MTIFIGHGSGLLASLFGVASFGLRFGDPRGDYPGVRAGLQSGAVATPGVRDRQGARRAWGVRGARRAQRRKGEQAAARMTGDVTVQALDLTSPDSVRTAAAALRS